MITTRLLAAIPPSSRIRQACGVARDQASAHAPSRETLTRGGFQLLVAFLLLQVLATPAAAVEDDFLCQKVFYTESGDVLTYPDGHEKAGQPISLSKGESVTVTFTNDKRFDADILGNDFDGDDKTVTLTYEDGQYKTFVKTLRNIVGVLMVMGPVAGIVMYLFATVAKTTQMDSGNSGGGANYSKARRDALVYGFSVPLAAYALEVLVSAIVGYNFGCLVP